MVTPTDLEQTTEALYAALTMPPDEKNKRATRLKKLIKEQDTTYWLLHLLEDAVNLAEQRCETST